MNRGGSWRVLQVGYFAVLHPVSIALVLFFPPIQTPPKEREGLLGVGLIRR